ncbi:hypothetical protein TPHA_0D01320 [Tetrapisispora phaffii CBS 4417]|uniref:Uncharacterized protein n=1 Tax=Tetrapisispora phaffii (strain ATCC 24235 / CBS 4417 / NBRC 1672 / NRRL Y-8282 / UCD 70-5) TaxID=1071381 RepID=G8BSF2_TETPH|nr:hypothetical protein TPHA_0D01320 [Tetrapisispora phaffii CBS 4417]CCE62773.1 hypothetical protein TPHA_0D01320 [Tetrapisispora phaffii CBS 4417]
MQFQILHSLFLLVALTSAKGLYSNSTVDAVAEAADLAVSEEYSATTTTLSPSFSVVPSVVVSTYSDLTTTVQITNTIYNTVYYTINAISSSLSNAAGSAASTTSYGGGYTSTTVTSTMKVTVTLDAVEVANLNKELNAIENGYLSSYAASNVYYSNATTTADACAPVTEYVTITADPITNFVTVTPEPVTEYVTLTASGFNSTSVNGTASVNGTLY